MFFFVVVCFLFFPDPINQHLFMCDILVDIFGEHYYQAMCYVLLNLFHTLRNRSADLCNKHVAVFPNPVPGGTSTVGCLPYPTHPFQVLESLLMSRWVESGVFY